MRCLEREWQYTLRSNKNNNLWDKLEIAPLEDKMRETRLKWFHHVQRRLIDATVGKVDSSEIIDTKG